MCSESGHACKEIAALIPQRSPTDWKRRSGISYFERVACQQNKNAAVQRGRRAVQISKVTHGNTA
jgi:hypothetical protein